MTAKYLLKIGGQAEDWVVLQTSLIESLKMRSHVCPRVKMGYSDVVRIGRSLSLPITLVSECPGNL